MGEGAGISAHVTRYFVFRCFWFFLLTKILDSIASYLRWGQGSRQFSRSSEASVRGMFSLVSLVFRALGASIINTIGIPLWLKWDQEGLKTQEKTSKRALNVVFSAG